MAQKNVTSKLAFSFDELLCLHKFVDLLLDKRIEYNRGLYVSKVSYLYTSEELSHLYRIDRWLDKFFASLDEVSDEQ